MQRVVCLGFFFFFSLLHTSSLHGLLILHQSTCFLINYFRDTAYQNYKTKLPIPSLPLMAIYRQVSGKKDAVSSLSWKRILFLQKREMCKEQHRHQIKNFFLGNQRMPSTEHRTSQESYQSLIWPVQAAHWVLNHLDFPWSKPSFWKKQRERQKLLKLSLELESNTGSYLKYRILNSQ